MPFGLCASLDFMMYMRVRVSYVDTKQVRVILAIYLRHCASYDLWGKVIWKLNWPSFKNCLLTGAGKDSFAKSFVMNERAAGRPAPRVRRAVVAVTV